MEKKAASGDTALLASTHLALPYNPLAPARAVLATKALSCRLVDLQTAESYRSSLERDFHNLKLASYLSYHQARVKKGHVRQVLCNADSAEMVRWS